MADTYTLGSHTFSSRLIVGSGKYASLEETRRCTEASGADMITVALRRVDLNAPKGERLLDVIPEGVTIAPNRARPGDVVIVSGEIGTHGIAIMSVREGLEFETVIETDSAPLNGLVAEMLDVSQGIHVLRDPTRGGVASALNEIAKASQVGIVLDEGKLPVAAAVSSAPPFR